MVAVLITLFSVSLSPAELQSPHDHYALSNMEQEFIYAAGLAKSNTNAVHSFSKHLADSISGFESLHILVLPKEGGFTVRVGNNLRESLGIQITTSNAQPATTADFASSGRETVFDFSSSGSSDITVNIEGRTSYSEKMHFEPGLDFELLYDFAIGRPDMHLRRKGIFEVSW